MFRCNDPCSLRWIALAPLLALIPSAASAAIFVVTNNNSSGNGSLADAIDDANATAGRDSIAFALPVHGSGTINVGALVISDDLLIDGYTQSGASPNTNGEYGAFNGTIKIELNASGYVGAPILDVTASDCVIRGLALYGSTSSAIRLRGGGGHAVRGCLVGLTRLGIHVGNTRRGIDADANGCEIGGPTPADRNVITGNGIAQIDIDADDVDVNGNLIGLLPDGDTVAGPGADGIQVDGDSCILGFYRGNVIAGVDTGILVSGDVNYVMRNRIGTDVTGTLDRGNTAIGLDIVSGSGNLVGASSGRGNLFCANDGGGVRLRAGVTDATLQANGIGVGEGGTPLPNGSWGIRVDTTGEVLIYGGNEIAYNDDGGVSSPAGGGDTYIRSSSIHDNLGLGIDHGADGVPSPPMSAPVVNMSLAPVGHEISGSFSGLPSTSYSIDIYGNPACDPTGYGEGHTIVLSTSATTNSQGDGSFSVLIPLGAPITTSYSIAMTAAGVTSEFTECVAAPTPFVVTNTASSGNGSLDTALQTADAFAGVDTITFDIPGPGPHVIPFTGYTATDPVIIDGFTQPGSAPNTGAMDELDDSVIKVRLDGLALQLEGNGSVVRGLSLTDIFNPLVLAGGGGHSVLGCRIGYTPEGNCSGGGGGVLIQSDGNFIGGRDPADRNLISTVEIDGDSNQVQGNFLGLGPDGLVWCSKTERVWIYGSRSNNVIGGDSLQLGNVISGGSFSGVFIGGGFTGGSGNVILGNKIGTDPTGTLQRPNGIGVWSNYPDLGWTLGSDDPAGANLIRFSDHMGIRISSGTNVTADVRINTIRNSRIIDGVGSGLAIDTGDQGYVDPPQDPGDEWTDRPVILTATTDGDSTWITGEMLGSVGQTASLYFYRNEDCDPSGYGEAETFLGLGTLPLTGSTTPFAFAFPVEAEPGVVSANANIDGLTSEMAACVAILSGATPVTVGPVVPLEFALHAAAPNPFRHGTDLRLDVARGEVSVRVDLFDVRGARVRTLVDGPLPPGRRTIRWDGRDDRGRPVASGVYFARLVADERTQTRRLVRTR